MSRHLMAKMRRRTAREMTYDEVMKRIDEQLAAGEPEDHSDYSTDYSFNHDPSIMDGEEQTEDDRLAEQAYRNQQEDEMTDRLWDQWMGQLTGKHHRWLEEVDSKAMDDDFANYYDHHTLGTPYTMAPVPEHELERQRRSLEGR